MSQVIYDIETYPNYFYIGIEHAFSDYRAGFECSEYRDDSEAMFATLAMLIREQVEMVGFNNLGFDYPVIHHLLRVCFDERGERQTRFGVAVAEAAYAKAEMIIGSSDRFGSQIWQSDRFAPQIDLYKLNHFDNPAKATSLKVLQFTMRAESVEDLPIPPGTRLTEEQARLTGEYCMHDIAETKRFAKRCAAEIEFRRAMAEHLDGDVLNWSDVKIGSELMIQRLGKKLCYYYDADNKRQPRQTKRSSIALADVIFPYIKFERRECRDLLERFRARVVTNTKASVSDAIELNGFTFAYGTGGVHGSVDRRAFHARDGFVIVDADVTSLYPNIAVKNGLYPEHLGETYGVEYAKILAERQRHAKGTPWNAALKLAANGTYGNTNNEWSPMYDPKYTMATTINGQLLLTMLAERLLTVPGLQLIQINTDGVTCYLPTTSRALYDAVCRTWQSDTALTLEFAEYKSFFCRDVNNYLAVSTGGKVKAKGAYDYPKTDADYSGWWHRDYSALCVQKAVESALVRGVPVEIAIRDNRDPFDFMCRFKTPRGSRLLLRDPVWGDMDQQRVSRYFVAKPSAGGLPLIKQSPPPDHAYAAPGAFKRKNGLTDAEFYKVAGTIPAGVWDERIHTKNKSTYGDREISVCGSARMCNRASDFDWSAVDYEWYIAESAKLVECFTP